MRVEFCGFRPTKTYVYEVLSVLKFKRFEIFFKSLEFDS